MNKNMYEVFNEFEAAPTKADKIEVLKRNHSAVSYAVLQMAFHPNIQFLIEKVPYYKPDDAPPGMGYSHLSTELDRIYLFIKDHPRAPPTLTQERREQILIQMLESLEAKEATVLMNMILKNLKVKGLTPKIVQEVYPDIFNWQ